MRNFARFIFILILFSGAACTLGETEIAETSCVQDNGVVLKDITEVMAVHVDAHKQGDASGAAAVYCDDVWILWEGGVESRSRADQERVYEQLHQQVVIKELTYTTDELTVCGDVAYEVGRVAMTVDANGQLSTSNDRYMVIWRHQPDDSWKVHRAVGHSDHVPQK
jgi:ketosteroid isomerase-like protein